MSGVYSHPAVGEAIRLPATIQKHKESCKSTPDTGMRVRYLSGGR